MRVTNRREFTLVFALLFVLSVLAPIDPVFAIGGSPVISIFAASSLSQVLPRLTEQWKSKSKSTARIQFNFESSSRLAQQIMSGAPADLFFSADERWMDFLQKKGKIDSSSRTDLLSNELVFVVPASAEKKWTHASASPRDILESSGLHRLALADPNVPVGRYAREALQSLGILSGLKSRGVDVISADNARSTLAWVARDEVDAGIVFMTDALSEKRVHVLFKFDPSSHSTIRYPAAIVSGLHSSREIRSFFDYCKSHEADIIFHEAGFIWLGK